MWVSCIHLSDMWNSLGWFWLWYDNDYEWLNWYFCTKNIQDHNLFDFNFRLLSSCTPLKKLKCQLYFLYRYGIGPNLSRYYTVRYGSFFLFLKFRCLFWISGSKIIKFYEIELQQRKYFLWPLNLYSV